MANADQQLAEMHTLLGTLTQQLQGIATRLDLTVAAGTATEASLALLRRDTHEALEKAHRQQGEGGRERRLQFVDKKDLKPILFGAKEAIHIRAWAKKTMNILNIQCPGVRQVLETAMMSKTPITTS